MAIKIHSEISVCETCMFSHANGVDLRHESMHGDTTQPEPWALWSFTEHQPAMGGEPDDEDEYRTSQCQGCGSYTHGKRYAFTMFYA